MTPDFKIIIDGRQDITNAIQNRLVSLGVNDSIDESADACQIVLSDPLQNLQPPEKNARIDVHIGYRGFGLQKMGTFFINEVVLSGFPATITINGSSANLASVMKIPKQRNWNGRTLGAIVETIAEESRSLPAVQHELKSFFFDKLSQDNESDHQFLHRIAIMLGAVYKPAGQKLAMFKIDSVTSVSGQPLPPISLPFARLTSWRYQNPDRALFDIVRTWWHDEQAGQYREIFARIGETGGLSVVENSPGGLIYTVRNFFSTKEIAVEEAKSILLRMKKSTEQLSLTMPGDTRFLCETPVTITGGRAEFNRQWIVAEAAHNISASGYITNAVLSPIVVARSR